MRRNVETIEYMAVLCSNSCFQASEIPYFDNMFPFLQKTPSPKANNKQFLSRPVFLV